MEQEQRVKKVIAEQFCVDEAEVTNDKTFADFNGDSLDQVELVIALEDEFGIVIKEEDWDGIVSVQTAIDYIAKVVS